MGARTGPDGPTRSTRATAGVSLGLVLAATLVVIGLGSILKAPCAGGIFDGRQYRDLCYSDIVPLYGTEQLTKGRLPYLDTCTPSAGQCDEYPVLSMYFMRSAAWIAQGLGPGTYSADFWSTAFLLTLCALATAWALWRIAGQRALLFAMAPTLLIYAFMNWDLFAVALAALGTVAYLRERDEWAGALLGLGTAAKLFPGLLLIPFALGRVRLRRQGKAVSLLVWAAVVYAAVNLPFALLAGKSWVTFFTFNSNRPVDWDSLWFVACQRLHGGQACAWSAHLVDALSVLLFAAIAAGVWFAKRSRDPDFPRWTFAFPLLIVFLLTSKVYSPQYGLWLLPWFALSLPNLRLFLAFEAADVAVFVTRFSWFGRLSADQHVAGFAGYHGVPLGGFEIAVVARAAVLLACVVAWILQRAPEGNRLAAPVPAHVEAAAA